MEYALLGVLAVVVIVAVASIAPRLGVAAPIILVLVGIATSYAPGVPTFELDPHLILTIVLPPILYSAAVNVPLMDFRRNFKAITWLSVVLVIITAVLTGLLLFWLFPDLSLPAAIALGAVVAPPDAVAATSIGKRLGLPHRLVTVLEGEGLVNDATALVLLRSAIAATAGAVSFVDIAWDFVLAVVIAIAVGAVVGFATVWVRSRLEDPVLTTAISFGVPFVAFFPAEEVHASGVLAVVVAGLITGHLGSKYFSPQARVSERTNWRTAQLLLENGVFLLMGFELHALTDQVHERGLDIWTAVWIGLVVTVALTAIRGVFVIPLIAVLRREQDLALARAKELDSVISRIDQVRAALPPGQELFPQRHARRFARRLRRKRADMDFLTTEGLSWRGGAVIAWSGMRGVVTLAAAQSLPSDLPYRPQLVLVAFTVAIVTLIAQGASLPWVIDRLDVRGSSEEAERVKLATLITELNSAGLATLDNPELRRPDGTRYPPEVIDLVREDTRRIGLRLTEQITRADDEGPLAMKRALRLRVLAAERAALEEARSEGSHASHVIERAQTILDVEQSRLDAH